MKYNQRDSNGRFIKTSDTKKKFVSKEELLKIILNSDSEIKYLKGEIQYKDSIIYKFKTKLECLSAISITETVMIVSYLVYLIIK